MILKIKLLFSLYIRFELLSLSLIIFYPVITFAKFIPKSDTTKRIIESPPKYKPLDNIKGDTLQKTTVDENLPRMPGGTSYTFTPEQDSAYYRALRYRLPITTRLNFDLNTFAEAIAVEMQKLDEAPWRVAMKSLHSIPDKFFIPSDVEKVQFESNIRMSQYVPHIPTLNPYGLKVGVKEALTFLGLLEDVSPVIKYNLDYTEDIEIVIYSVNATVIATLYQGKQAAGNHIITWNGRDDKGRRMPSGDYIGEVRIGNERYIRKRIVIP